MLVNSDLIELLSICTASKVKFIEFEGLTIPFISKEDLIVSKLASGRPQDLLDVESLRTAP